MYFYSIVICFVCTCTVHCSYVVTLVHFVLGIVYISVVVGFVWFCLFAIYGSVNSNYVTSYAINFARSLVVLISAHPHMQQAEGEDQKLMISLVWP